MSLTAYSVSATNNSNTVTAQDIENLMDGSLGDLMITVKSYPEELGLTQTQVSNAYLGTSFSIANLSDNNNYELASNIAYLPLISDGDVIAIVTVIKKNNRFNCTVGKDFAAELDSVMKSSIGNVALISENMDIIAVDSTSESNVIFDYPGETALSSSRSLRTYENSCVPGNTITLNKLFEQKFTMPTTVLPTTRAYNYLDYPIVYQGDYSICWAAVAASMIMYEMPTQYPELYATTVCNRIGHGYTMGQPEDVITALETYLPSIYAPTIIYSPLSTSDIEVVIDNNDPACMFALPDHHMIEGHCTALCGYKIVGSTFQARYMCPMFQAIKFTTYDASNGFQYTIGSFTFTWVYTARLYYNL